MSRDPFDLVRDWFTAFNRGDLVALQDFYAGRATLHSEEGVAEGLDAIGAAWDARFETWAPGFGGGVRRRLRMVGRVETGVIRAEWVERESRDAGRHVRERTGVSDFEIESSQIWRQRETAREGVHVVGDEDSIAPAVPPPSRLYPPRPVVGVGAVIMQQGRVVLIRRKFEPLAGEWSLPGGTLELGESLEAGVAREMHEETSLEVEVGAVIEVFDRILLDADGRVRYHFVLIDYLCTPRGGTLQAGSDVDAAVWADPADLAAYRLTAKAVAVIRRALTMSEVAEPGNPDQPVEPDRPELPRRHSR